MFLMTANCMYTVNVSLTPFTVLFMLYNIMHCYRITRFVDVRTCYLNSSCGYYLRAATIFFSASGCAASIRERRLIKRIWYFLYGHAEWIKTRSLTGQNFDSHLRELKLWHLFPIICLYREAMHLQCFTPTHTHVSDDYYPILQKIAI